MTDAELDRNWVPNGRRPLSKFLKDAKPWGKNNQELADLEARIRDMEERLRRKPEW
ncbi:hypothetical protein J3459_006519 [Metarhizium acridum]|nr:hypothetical protein J3459_006519 [Metarhizium acridum]